VPGVAKKRAAVKKPPAGPSPEVQALMADFWEASDDALFCSRTGVEYRTWARYKIGETTPGASKLAEIRHRLEVFRRAEALFREERLLAEAGKAAAAGRKRVQAQEGQGAAPSNAAPLRADATLPVPRSGLDPVVADLPRHTPGEHRAMRQLTDEQSRLIDFAWSVGPNDAAATHKAMQEFVADRGRLHAKGGASGES